ncbi:MAG TPA: hypothetical protein VMA31_00845 [Bryobacteraceae bacterium]|nr:hypothetical protein [Bryobacteraceae bacterium]
MSNFTPVKPGDLITAAYLNQMFASFDSRISALEAASQGGAQIVIQQLLPIGTFYVGNQMHIVGQNFGLPANVVVTIGGVKVTTFLAGSGNTDLYFDIPAVQGLSLSGTQVTLTIDNGTSPAPASTTFTLFPAPLSSPSGNILITMTTPPSVGTITAGNSYVYGFTVTGFTSLTDNYSVTATLDAASQTAGWTVTPTANSVTIPQGQNTATQVGVKVTIPATAGVTSAQITVTLVSSLKPGISGSGSTTVTVNSAPPPPNTIGLTLYAAGAGTVSADGSSLALPHGTTSVVVIVLASVPDGGANVSYNVSNLTFDSASWASVLQSPANVPVGAPNSTLQLRYQISVPSGPSSTNMHASITESGKASVQGQQAFTISVA